MKRITFFVLTFLALFLVSCQDKITIKIDSSIDVYINELYELEYSTNDKKGLTFESVDESLFNVDENGVIVAFRKGQGILIITSKTNEDIKVLVTINVLESFYLHYADELSISVGEEKILDIVTNIQTGLNFTSSDDSILTINEEGKIKGLKSGVSVVTITSKEYENISKEITVTVTEGHTIIAPESVTVKRNETHKLNIETDIPKGVSFESLNENVLTVSNDGTITAINKGITSVKVISNSDPLNYTEVVVTVTQLEDAIYEARIEASETFQIGDLITNPIYISEDEDVAIVNSNGLITAVSSGYTTIKVVNEVDDTIYEEFTVYVTVEPEDFTVVGSVDMLVGQTQTLDIDVMPINGSKDAIYQSLNASVLNVTLNGVVTAINTGTTGIRVTSLSDPTLVKTFYITVSNIMVVDESKSLGDVIEYSSFTLEYGNHLFSNINDALTKATNNTEIVVKSGTYNEVLIIDRGVKLVSQGSVTINGNIIIASKNVTVDGFTIKNGNITNTANISNVEILNNKFINTNLEKAISLENIDGVNVSYNEIIGANVISAITIVGIKAGSNYIKGNIIKDVDLGIKIVSDKNYHIETLFDVMWNDIDNVIVGFNINLGSGSNVNEIRKVVRFNKLTNYETALETISGHDIDLSLNYWGEVPNISKFINVTMADLEGYYTDKEEIVLEGYDIRIPVKIEITNKKDEVEVGEEYTIEFIIYPKELSESTVRWHYSNLPALEVNGSTIKGVVSWDVEITLSARNNSSVYDSFVLSITTDPGLDFVPEDATYADFYVGNSFKLNVNVLPYQIREKGVIFASSDEDIATISEGGIVTLLSEGAVTISAHLEMDPEINQEFKFVVFDEIDKNDPFGFAISTMLNHSLFRTWNVYGVEFDYQAEYQDSVSRLLIEDIEIDTSLIIPEQYAPIRPGTGAPRTKPNLPESQIYNEEYVQYVVVHETANTNVGGGAYWHAMYLWNGYINGTDRYASWHYTVDDEEIYQHIPLDEVAYHAGDGSTVAGSTWNNGKEGGIGGGNRNGIGIETSVAYGDEIMSIWHRVARLSAVLSKQFNLPGDQHRQNVKFHQDFSGKVCPQSIIRGGYVDYFYRLVETEYKREYDFEGLSLSINSHDLEYLSNNGRIIKRPLKAITVSYDLIITYGEETRVETLYVYIPGQIK